MPALNYGIILRSGELTPLDEVVRLQRERRAIYGTALHDVRGELPLALVRARPPEVLALGSSRAFDLREEYFSRPFVCACGAMDSIDDGEPLAERLLERSRPKLVLLALDFWWFTTDRPQRGKPLQPERAVELTRDKVLAPGNWVRQGTLSAPEYLRLLMGERDLQGATRHPKIGVQAIKRGIGIRADGSELNGVRLGPGAFQFYAEQRNQLDNVGAFVMGEGPYRAAAIRYGPDKVVVDERLRSLDRVLGRLRAAGAQVVLFQPPVAPPVAAAMAASGRHGYLGEIDRALRGRGVEYHNFHDPLRVGVSSLCEFADAHHSGNTMFMRVLQAILKANPRSALAPYVERAKIDAGIRRYAGRTIATFDEEEFLGREVDFLGAGCRVPPK